MNARDPLREWQIAGIENALKDLDAGKTIPHDRVRAWAQALGTERELPPPISVSSASS
jgi:predicted transcriptional regulator